MLDLLPVDGLNLVDVQIEFRSLRRNSRRDFVELCVATTYDGSSTSAGRWTVVVAQTTHIGGS